MFVVQEAVATNNAATEDLNGKRMISFLIVFTNAAAGGLYPLYRFVTAWAESGDIDFYEVTASLLASCCPEGWYDDAAEAEEQINEARDHYDDINEGVAEVRSAAADLLAEADEARVGSNVLAIEEDREIEIQEDPLTVADQASASGDVHTIEEDYNSENQKFGDAPVNAVSVARPTPSPRARISPLLSSSPSSKLPPVVCESIHGLSSSDFVFRQYHEMTEQSISVSSIPIFDNARINLKPR